MNLINKQSFTLAALLILIVMLFLLFRDGPKRRDFVILGVLVIGLAAIWLLVRPTASPINGVDEVSARIGTGTPVLLEFQSPY